MKLLRLAWHVVSMIVLLGLIASLAIAAWRLSPPTPQQHRAPQENQYTTKYISVLCPVSSSDRQPSASGNNVESAAEQQAADNQPNCIPPETIPDWAMVIVSFLAVLVAAKTYGAVVEQSKATTKAAGATERSVLYAHRPRLALRHILAKGITAGIIKDRIYDAKAWIVNTGSMPTTFLGLHAQWLIRSRLPTSNPALGVELGQVDSVEMEPGQVIQRTLPDYKPDQTIPDVKWWSDISDRSPHGYRIYLIGFIKYRDAVGLRRRYFAYRYSPRRRRFIVLKHPNYNYED